MEKPDFMLTGEEWLRLHSGFRYRLKQLFRWSRGLIRKLPQDADDDSGIRLKIGWRMMIGISLGCLAGVELLGAAQTPSRIMNLMFDLATAVVIVVSLVSFLNSIINPSKHIPPSSKSRPPEL